MQDQVGAPGARPEHGDHARVVDPPGCIQTYSTRRVQCREGAASQQKSMLGAARVNVSAHHRARVINPIRIYEGCARNANVGELSLGPREPDFRTLCAGAPARSNTQVVDAIKGDGGRAGSSYAIRPVGLGEGAITTQDHAVLDPGVVDVIAGDCT